MIHEERVLGPRDDFRAFLMHIDFPNNGVIVRPENLYQPIFKGLQSERAVLVSLFYGPARSVRTEKRGKGPMAKNQLIHQNVKIVTHEFLEAQ